MDIAEAAARAGFDEIMFDYIRFPTDGDRRAAVFPGKARTSAKGGDDRRVPRVRAERLKPLGVRVSAAVFGLSATRDLGIGQAPRLHRPAPGRDVPDGLPVALRPGRVQHRRPEREPGRTVAMSLRTSAGPARHADARIVPWLQDFTLGRTYTLAEIAGPDRRGAASRRRRVPALERRAASTPSTAHLRPQCKSCPQRITHRKSLPAVEIVDKMTFRKLRAFRFLTP